MKIGIIGGGVWGSALAKLLSANKVVLYARDSKIVNNINEHRFNPKLKYAVFNENVSAEKDLNLCNDEDIIFIALPSQAIRVVLSSIKLIDKNKKIVIASKGIEIQSSKLLKNVVEDYVHSKNIGILSGPCFSNEVAQNLPTAVTFASEDKNLFEKINDLFINKNFRIYYSDDVIGCQVGGALKNIYAIASGITMGLNLGENARSALITRSFVEISRLGKALGGKEKTFFGLSGLGDLILTCNSLKSRNTKFGNIISTNKKQNILDILKQQDMTEGYYTVEAVKKIAEQKKIDMPIMNAVYNILYNNLPINEEIKNLLERPYKDE